MNQMAEYSFGKEESHEKVCKVIFVLFFNDRKRPTLYNMRWNTKKTT
jgi:hypothetical protein